MNTDDYHIDRKQDERDMREDWERDQMMDRKWEQAQERKRERPTPITNAEIERIMRHGQSSAELRHLCRKLERQLAEAREEHKHTSGNLYDEHQAHGLTKGKLTECQLALAAAIRERDQARADATEWGLNLTTAIREITEANEKIQGLQDGIDYATDALMREKTLADRLAGCLSGLFDEYEDRKCQWGNQYLWQKHEDDSVISNADEAITAWKEARNVQ